MGAPGDGFLVITKTPPVWKKEQSNKDEMYGQTQRQFARLKVGKKMLLKTATTFPTINMMLCSSSLSF